MKLENLSKITRLSNEMSRLNGMIGQAIPHSDMRINVNLEARNVPSIYFDIDDCSFDSAGAITSIILAELRKKRDAVAEELRALGVDV